MIGHSADVVRDALIENLSDLPPQLRRSLTWDRGREMIFHDQIAHVLDADVLLRCAFTVATRIGRDFPARFAPKGAIPQQTACCVSTSQKNADLRSFSQADLDAIAGRINERPHKVLEWVSSHDVFTDSLNTISGALTG